MSADDPEDDNPLQRWIDAEERWGDPESLGDESESGDDAESPLSTAPEPPEPPGRELAEIEVDSRTKKYFWGAVVLANVALGSASLGLMLIGFRSQWALGGGLVVLGLLAGVRTYRLYREYTNDLDDVDRGPG